MVLLYQFVEAVLNRGKTQLHLHNMLGKYRFNVSSGFLFTRFGFSQLRPLASMKQWVYPMKKFKENSGDILKAVKDRLNREINEFQPHKKILGVL